MYIYIYEYLLCEYFKSNAILLDQAASTQITVAQLDHFHLVSAFGTITIVVGSSRAFTTHIIAVR